MIICVFIVFLLVKAIYRNISIAELKYASQIEIIKIYNYIMHGQLVQWEQIRLSEEKQKFLK